MVLKIRKNLLTSLLNSKFTSTYNKKGVMECSNNNARVTYAKSTFNHVQLSNGYRPLHIERGVLE